MRSVVVSFIVATAVALTLAVVTLAADWSKAVTLAVGAVAASLVVSLSVPYVFGAQQRRRRVPTFGDGHGSTPNGIRVELDAELIAAVGEHRTNAATIPVRTRMA